DFVVWGPEALSPEANRGDASENPQGPSTQTVAGALSYNTAHQNAILENGVPGQTDPTNFLAGVICEKCGAALTPNDFRPAPLVPVPVNVTTRRVPNGQEIISIVGGLELNTPVWANEQHEFPYLQWQMEVHSAKLKAAFPHTAEEI